jgi:hypothetical protein
MSWTNKTYLGEQITEGPSNEGRAGLGSQGVLVKSLIVGGPSRDGSTANQSLVAKERAGSSRLLAKGRLDSRVGQLGDTRFGGDAKGARREEGRNDKDRSELHDDLGWEE